VQIFLHSASNFKHQKLEAKHKKNYLGTSSSEAPRKAEAKKIALSLQLLALKVGGQAQENLLRPFLKLPSLELKSFKRGQGKFFCFHQNPMQLKNL
jgi:hypothetical protein